MNWIYENRMLLSILFLVAIVVLYYFITKIEKRREYRASRLTSSGTTPTSEVSTFYDVITGVAIVDLILDREEQNKAVEETEETTSTVTNTSSFGSSDRSSFFTSGNSYGSGSSDSYSSSSDSSSSSGGSD